MNTSAQPNRHAATPVAREADDATQPAPLPHSRFAKWRALSLSLVYIVFGIHIVHWKLSGKTMAPVELNEVMYTLELGIITAGFLFMCALVLGTLVFGRFFCSWACHIMVLQDLCAWILRKLHIARKPLRSRLLLLVPPLTALYMFVWPQVVRAWQSRALPTFHLATDREGWASLVTSNFWRNLPGPSIIALTFLTCGFVMVYLLGTRTFCTYVCPYGAIFGLADRFSPARIRVQRDRCRQCGSCTAVCTSGIRVHEEVKLHGMVVNSSCLKDLDCVGRCPQQALHYGFGRPALFRSWRSGGRFGRQAFDFTPSEELVLAATFIAVFLTYRGLYSRIPFLLALAFGVVGAYCAVTAWRLVRRANVRLANISLKRENRLSVAGLTYGVAMLAITALTVHSAGVRFHEYRGLSLTRVIQAAPEAAAPSLLSDAHAHLETAARWGLVGNPNVQRSLLALSTRLGKFEDAVAQAHRLIARFPEDVAVRLQLAQCLLQDRQLDAAQVEFEAVVARAGGDSRLARTHLIEAHQGLAAIAMLRTDYAAAETALNAVISLDARQAGARAQLGGALAELGRWPEALEQFTVAASLEPSLAAAHYNRGIMLARMARTPEAVSAFKRAAELAPDDADVLNNLGFSLWRDNQPEQACLHLERALALQPGHANAHFNLARVLRTLGEPDLARLHLEQAARLDPHYARLLRNGP